MKLIKLIVFTYLFVAGTPARAWNIQTGDLTSWIASLKPLPSVSEQIELFWKNNGADSAYVQSFPIEVKNKLFNEIENSLSCANAISVDFPENILVNSPVSARDFENGFLRVESMNCLGELDLEKVFNVFMSKDFQSRTIKGLKKFTLDEAKNKVCQQTSVFGIGDSAYCFTQHIWRNDSKYMIHSFNETNADHIEAPVYFREVLTVLEKLPSDDIVIYNLVYGRGPNLPFKGIVKNIVKNQQENLISELVRSAR